MLEIEKWFWGFKNVENVIGKYGIKLLENEKSYIFLEYNELEWF